MKLTIPNVTALASCSGDWVAYNFSVTIAIKSSVMRDNMENLAASGVIKLLEEKPQRAEEILAEFMDDPNIEQNADAFVHNAVKTLIEVMNYQDVAKVVQDQAAYEDFNHDKKSNFRAKDFDFKRNHTRVAIQTVSLDELHDTVNNDGEGAGLQTPDLLTDVF